MTSGHLEILAYEPTPLGPLCLRRRELLRKPGTIVTEVTLNHEFLMSSYHTESERQLARIALDMHSGSSGLNVLVGGLGLGFTAREVLASTRVGRLEVVEFLPEVIAWLARGLLPDSRQLSDDPRGEIVQGDVYDRLSQPAAGKFDLILIDVDHSPEECLAAGSNQFYTHSGLQLAKEHLNTEGILAVWSYAEHSPFADALRTLFREVRVEPVTFENDLIDEMQSDWLFFARN